MIVHIIPWEDVRYTLRFKADPGGYSAEFELFSMVCMPPSEITYPRKDWNALPSDSTTDLDDAEACVEGWIKWDGCTEFSVSGSPGGRHHVCSQSGMAWLATALDRIYGVASEHMPHWLGS